jgi:hypothetical protein
MLGHLRGTTSGNPAAGHDVRSEAAAPAAHAEKAATPGGVDQEERQ